MEDKFSRYENVPMSVYDTLIDEYLPGRGGKCTSSDDGSNPRYRRCRVDGCRVQLWFKRNSEDLGTLCMVVEDSPKDKKEAVYKELDSIILSIAGRKQD